ncbi:glycosidase [Kribbella voronezhensis]|uniref:Glycosidase n=1 Tax=Kribbella voronezhensis TaxID=2512212 RepID=A0A4R7TDR8_9ACTN|nr:alpha-amylase family glycosyl hydrolase [Kribbella voronezhensis]TDU90280.1 glycosidase [Kribbella voronezhensis]
MPLWADHAIWWHVYPLGFTGAEATAPAGRRVVHRLPRLENWLDYAIELGCSGLLLGPVFESETHGYDTVDHFQIDPRLGDYADFDRLVAAAKARGLRIVLDGVFNHVARSFAAKPEWFRRHPDGAQVFFEGHEHLLVLNHELPEIREYVVDVMCHWLERGIDGWRLDAAYAVAPEFWAGVLAQVRERYPEAWFVGELIHGDYAGYAATSTLDSVTQYELWKAIWSSLNDGNFFELAYALERHQAVVDPMVPQTFVGNHDVTRIATKLDDDRHLGHALAILFGVAGIPSVYYGDEQAMTGLKEDRVGGDDAVRPEFPEKPDQLADADWTTYRLHQRLIGVRRRNAWLTRSRTKVVHLTNKALALRSGDARGQLLLLLNVGDEAYHFPVEVAGLVIAAQPDHSPLPEEPLLVAPHSWRILTSP